jgi:hypothetical protein
MPGRIARETAMARICAGITMIRVFSDKPRLDRLTGRLDAPIELGRSRRLDASIGWRSADRLLQSFWFFLSPNHPCITLTSFAHHTEASFLHL